MKEKIENYINQYDEYFKKNTGVGLDEGSKFLLRAGINIGLSLAVTELAELVKKEVIGEDVPTDFYSKSIDTRLS